MKVQARPPGRVPHPRLPRRSRVPTCCPARGWDGPGTGEGRGAREVCAAVAVMTGAVRAGGESRTRPGASRGPGRGRVADRAGS